MLIARIYVNERQIDSIYIKNISGDLDGECEYKIVGTDEVIIHNRPDGYKKLLAEALRRLDTVDNQGSTGHDIDLWDSIAVFTGSDGGGCEDSAGWAHGVLIADADTQHS